MAGTAAPNNGGAGGNGGPGIVILRAPGPLGPTFSVTPGGCKSTLPGPAGGCTVLKFTASGTLTIS
jgi:hypothetical protein